MIEDSVVDAPPKYERHQEKYFKEQLCCLVKFYSVCSPKPIGQIPIELHCI